MEEKKEYKKFNIWYDKNEGKVHFRQFSGSRIWNEVNSIEIEAYEKLENENKLLTDSLSKISKENADLMNQTIPNLNSMVQHLLNVLEIQECMCHNDENEVFKQCLKCEVLSSYRK